MISYFNTETYMMGEKRLKKIYRILLLLALYVLMNTLSVDECFLCNSGQYYMTWVIFKSDGRMSQPLLNVESPLWMHNACTCSLGLKV